MAICRSIPQLDLCCQLVGKFILLTKRETIFYVLYFFAHKFFFQPVSSSFFGQLGPVSEFMINYCASLEDTFAQMVYFGILKEEDAQCLHQPKDQARYQECVGLDTKQELDAGGCGNWARRNIRLVPLTMLVIFPIFSAAGPMVGGPEPMSPCVFSGTGEPSADLYFSHATDPTEKFCNLDSILP